MYAAIGGHAGNSPFNDWFVPDTTQRHALGLVVPAVDNYWGWGEFVYTKSADAVLKGSVCMMNGSMNLTLAPSTAGQGFPLFVAMNAMASGVYGWVMKAGLAVHKTNATVAADAAIGIAAAGILGTNAAGKQVLGARVWQSATGTRTRTVNTTNGSCVLECISGYDGWYLGGALSGTGIPASTVVAQLDPDGKRVYMGSAIATVGDKTATATGQVTGTLTNTGYGLALINNPFAQGAIT